MNCPACGSLEARIARTIMGPTNDIRQRRCRCGVTWQTIEKVVKGTVQVKLPGEITPTEQVKMVAAQETAQVEKGGKGVSPLGIPGQPLSLDLDSDSSLLGKPRARRGRPSTGAYDTDFVAFWDGVTIHRGNKQPAFKAWVKIKRELGSEFPEVNFIITRYLRWEQTSQWQDGFAPYVATWINARGWETEPEAHEFRKRGNGAAAKSDENLDNLTDFLRAAR